MTTRIYRVPLVRWAWEVDLDNDHSVGGWTFTRWGARRAAARAMKEER